MLNPSELYTLHPEREYLDFMMAYAGDSRAIHGLSREFDRWHGENRRQLKEMYEEDRDSCEYANFITWAREHFYLWKYNQEKKLIKAEIERLTS